MYQFLCTVISYPQPGHFSAVQGLHRRARPQPFSCDRQTVSWGCGDGAQTEPNFGPSVACQTSPDKWHDSTDLPHLESSQWISGEPGTLVQARSRGSIPIVTCERADLVVPRITTARPDAGETTHDASSDLAHHLQSSLPDGESSEGLDTEAPRAYRLPKISPSFRGEDQSA